jgi:DNA-binding helix-hairpin-helix protein with protein kinase domain
MSLQPGARVWACTPYQHQHDHWEEVTLGALFGDGGTANIHVKNSGTLIKVYRDLSAGSLLDYFHRVAPMAIDQLRLRRRLPFVALPQAVLFRTRTLSPDAFIGYTMPLVPNAKPLSFFTVDYGTLEKAYQDKWPNTLTPHTQQLIAWNVVEAFERLHRCGYLFGDPNANNILVDTTTFDATVIDVDSFAIPVPSLNPNRTFHPPPASTPRFRSPSVAAQAGTDNTRPIRFYTEADDNYVCAIHVFSLLIQGFPPFSDEQTAMKRRFAFAGPARSLPDDCHQMKLFNALPNAMRQAFVAAFVDGRPPTPAEWGRLFSTHWGYLRAPHGYRPVPPSPWAAFP